MRLRSTGGAAFQPSIRILLCGKHLPNQTRETTIMHPGFVIVLLWAGFGVSWVVAAAWSDRPEKRAGVATELRYRIIQIAGAALFFVPAHGYRGPLRLWQVDRLKAWICAGLLVLGFAFAWWARVHLGRLWSGSITKKAEHVVIDTGPYGIVRHPIYTGILLAVFATMAAKGTVWGVAGAVTITLGLWLKARLEECWLSQELGEEAYAAYRRRVPMLLPFGPKSS